MDKNKNLLESIIDFAWASGADLLFVQNAKEELKKLRDKNKEWAEEVYRANEFAVEKTNEYLKISQQMQALKNSLESREEKS